MIVQQEDHPNRIEEREFRRGLVILLVVFAYGLGIELVQGQLPNRYFGIGDLLANTVGTLLGGMWLVAERYVRYRHLPAKNKIL